MKIYTFQVVRVIEYEMEGYSKKIKNMRLQNTFENESDEWWEHMISCNGCNRWSHKDIDVQNFVEGILKQQHLEFEEGEKK